MQSAVEEGAVVIPRKVWTRDEAHALVALGFPNAEKLELIEGELIDRMGKKHLHMLWQKRVHRWLVGVFGWDFVRSEGSTDVAPDDNEHNEPEPDFMVTKHSIEDSNSLPTPGDLKLVVEISDSTVAFDLSVKARLYARAGIVEYWVVDVQGKRLIVHREPVDGAYSSLRNFGSNEEVAPITAPDFYICLDRL